MKKFMLLTIAVCLASCFSMKRETYALYECFQIGNTSSETVTVRFYEKGKPLIVHYDVYDQSSPVAVSLSDSKKDRAEVQSGSELALDAGQTALFYSDRNTLNPGGMVNSLYSCGTSDGEFSLFFNRSFFLGDSVTVAVPGIEPIELPVDNNELWETWYDEKKFIYYHLWRMNELN